MILMLPVYLKSAQYITCVMKLCIDVLCKLWLSLQGIADAYVEASKHYK